MMATPAMAQMATTAMIIFCIKIPPADAALRTVFLFTDSITDTEPHEKRDFIGREVIDHEFSLK